MRCGHMRKLNTMMIIALLIAAVIADDKSNCERKCSEKYEEGSIRDACNVGCGARSQISQGPFAFVDCYQSCDNSFNQENKSGDASEAHSACSYACSLPMSRSFFMSVRYTNNEKPVVKIIHKVGDEVMEPPPMGGGLDQFMSNLFGDMNHNPFYPKPVIVQHSSVQHNANTSVDDSRLESAGARYVAMHNDMNRMLAAFSKQFFDGIRRKLQRHRHLFTDRPTGHDYFSHMGPEIGNLLNNGESILLTRPLTKDEENQMSRPIKVFRYQSSSNHPPSIFYWIMIVFGIGALLLTLYASVIFFRVMRSAAYKRISADVANGRPSATMSTPGILPVKKVPLDGWADHSEPSGVPPPAYDQVSIHSFQKQQQSDNNQTQMGADTNSSSTISEQK